MFAADDPLAFGKGPAKWLMTREEERAWKAVKTVDEAQKFIDLFWARRDPTPGTYANEFKAEVEGRILYADAHFKEGRDRGSLTERGRVMVSLGPPTNMEGAVSKYQKQESGGADITGGHRLAARDVWRWDHADAVKKFNMPKVEVVFLKDDRDNTSHRDPQRADFLVALPVAIKRAIVSPDLTEVPEWAKPQLATEKSNVVLRVETQGESTQTVATTTSLVPAAKPTAKPKSAGKLTLVRDAFAIDAQENGDPFAGLASLESFKSGTDLGFVAEYCAGEILEELAGVTVQAKISGTIKGEKINMTGPVEELVPDSIRVSPGCHLVRGAIPLEGVDPGKYTFAVTVAAGADKYNLSREFRVE